MGIRIQERSMNATEVFEAIRAFGEHEHRDLARGLDRIHSAGCRLGAGPKVDDVRAIREVLRWTVITLQPHIAWEESWLYPQIEAITQTPWSTRAARFDHTQIEGLATRLRQDSELAGEGLTTEGLQEVRSHLFGYEAVLRAHIDREERQLLPVFADQVALAGHTAGDALPT
jgi:hemerythrin-like domain-containing protein